MEGQINWQYQAPRMHECLRNPSEKYTCQNLHVWRRPCEQWGSYITDCWSWNGRVSVPVTTNNRNWEMMSQEVYRCWLTNGYLGNWANHQWQRVKIDTWFFVLFFYESSQAKWHKHRWQIIQFTDTLLHHKPSPSSRDQSLISFFLHAGIGYSTTRFYIRSRPKRKGGKKSGFMIF